MTRTAAALRRLLDHHDLWRFVHREDDSSPGCFHFRVNQLVAFRDAVRAHPRLVLRARGDAWQAREIGTRGVLHLKHFEGWPPNKIQAHVDPWGARPHRASWLLPFVPLGCLIAHAVDARGYQDLDRVERLLHRRGL